MRTILFCLCLALALPGFAAPLRVCASTPDLGDLVRQVGGPAVTVTIFVKGTEDPHFIQARPSFVKQLSQADLFIVAGLDLEAGWAPVLVKNCRNKAVQENNPGYLNVATAITPKFDFGGPIDRGAGHVHPAGNPHYLLDPINGLRAARLIRDRLAELLPADADAFRQRYDDFQHRLAVAMVGPSLADTYDVEKLADLYAAGTLTTFLAQTGEQAQLGGWLAELTPFAGAKVVDDHDMWVYFTDRFRLRVVAHLEPKPGVTPTTSHLGEVVADIRRDQVKVLLTACYFPARHAQFVADATGVKLLPMCHQTAARPEADSYLAMCAWNIDTLAKGLR